MTTLNSQTFVNSNSQEESNPQHRTSLLGMPLNAVTESEALQFIEERLDKKRGTWILTPNLDILRQYFTKPELRPLFHANEGGADLLVADGMPLVWASQLTGHAVPERVPGSGLVLSLAKRARYQRVEHLSPRRQRSAQPAKLPKCCSKNIPKPRKSLRHLLPRRWF